MKAAFAMCALVLFAYNPYNAGDSPSAIDRGKQKRTLADMRALATTISMYGIDHDSFPPSTSVASLREFLEPDYTRRTPVQGGWGHDFRYVSWRQGELSKGPDHFLLLSPGKDGKWETDNPRGYEPEATVGMDSDLVLAVTPDRTGSSETRFIRAPEWVLQLGQESAAKWKALASAETIDSVPLLQYEIEWAEPEWMTISQLRKREDGFRRHLDELRANNSSLEAIVPSTPGVRHYVGKLGLMAELGGVSFHASDPRTVHHDRYQEIIIEAEIRGAKEPTADFLSYLRNGARLASWREPEVIDSATNVSFSIFAVPPVKEVELRQCRPIDAGSLPSDDREIERSKNHLEKLCEQLDEHRELRVLFDETSAIRERLELVLDLVRVYH